MRSPSKSPMMCDDLSSPDPLASSPSIAGSTTRLRHSVPISATRGQRNIRKSIENVSILPPSSPSKTVTEQTLSPWKIRVTVEAEPEDDANAHVETVTRTTSIPLKQSDSPSQRRSSAAPKTSSRPRASSITSNRRRSTTPTTDRRRKQSVTDLDIIVLGDDADEDEWGRRQRKASPKKSRTRRKVAKESASDTQGSGAVQFEVRQDTDGEEMTHTTDREDSPELRQIDLNRVSVRTRSNSNKANVKFDLDSHNDQFDVRQVKPLPGVATLGRRTVSANSAMTYPTPSPTASERGHSVEAHDMVDEVEAHPEGFDTIMESEGFTMIDLDSIPSVKRMLSSPLEGQAKTSPPHSESNSESSVRKTTASGSITNPKITAYAIAAAPPHIVLPEGESEISSTLPSSPPSFIKQPQAVRQQAALSHLQVPIQPRNRQVTPQPYSSPRLPSPPRQPVSRDRSTPDSAKAMRAALALQGAMEPTTLPVVPLRQQLHQPMSKQMQHSRSSSDELFEGFDSGTQRELRAGLRFGEELAKRQQSNAVSHKLSTAPDRPAQSQIWRGESVISRTPTQGHATKEQDNGDGIAIDGPLVSTYAMKPVSHTTHSTPFDNTTRLEQEWDRERQAVSKQINEASPSKVIVIESDSEDSYRELPQPGQEHSGGNLDLRNNVDYDDGDIWLEEAKDSSSSPRQEADSVPFTQTLHQNQKVKSINSSEKPRRSLIFSSWKQDQQSDHANNSTILTNGDDISGVMWKQQDSGDIQFGAAAINNVREELKKSDNNAFNLRRTSGSFDIEKMLGTPKRIRDTLAREQEKQLFSSRESTHLTPTYSREDQQNAARCEEDEEETIGQSLYSDESDCFTQRPTQSVPVNFNDSTIPHSQTTPPYSSRARVSTSPPVARPPTPRSAMKGSRQSFGAAIEAQELAGRRVIFAERCKGVNVDWVENSSTLQSSDENDVDSPTVEHQLHHEQRQLISTTSSHAEHVGQILSIQSSPEQHRDVEQPEARDQDLASNGWLGWMWNSKPTQATTEVANAVQVDGTSEHSQTPSPSQPQVGNGAISHATTQPQYQHGKQLTKQLHSTPRPRAQLPSYLLPPSYPSDPARSADTPLSAAGSFTNTHFRTLHILHRKSQRPRFHAPKLSTCRREIRALVSQRWKLSVDESAAGLGGFAWTVGETEARVLERFCQEVEFGYLKKDISKEDLGAFSEEWCGIGGIWGGNVEHGSADVKWGWSIEQLATWLGRIVVGEVVREEEYGGKNAH